MTGDTRISSTPIAIADAVVENPVRAVARYLEQHHGTVSHFDLFKGDRTTINHALIKVTRTPWMNSRISEAEADWFISRARSAPWQLLAADAELNQADPTEADGVYDSAVRLYMHFFGQRKGVAVAKVSKVLHLTRPHLFPIPDSRLWRLYRDKATSIAEELVAKRPSLAGFGRLYWAAIRVDLLDNQAQLDELRNVLRRIPVPNAAAVADHVGDVRILDMIAWGLGSDRSAG